jgi:hypothetical protein
LIDNFFENRSSFKLIFFPESLNITANKTHSLEETILSEKDSGRGMTTVLLSLLVGLKVNLTIWVVMKIVLIFGVTLLVPGMILPVAQNCTSFVK